MYWVSQNPPPAHLFLISGDKDFAEVLHRLRMNNYNILIASMEISNVLCSVATIVWHWNLLLRGENVKGKHFNHPPDGLYGTWYGHHDEPLEDPFPDGKKFTFPRIEEFPKSISGLNLRPIPKLVVRQVHQILSSYPNGIPLTCLRMELEKAGISLPKDYYGYKKFSLLLLSVACVHLQVVPAGLIAHYISKKSPKPIASSFVSSTELVDNEELNHVATSMASSHELSGEDIPEKVKQVADVTKTKSQLPPKENEILCSTDASQAVAETATCHIVGSTESVVAKSSGGHTETHSSTVSKRLTFMGWIGSWWPFRKKVQNTHNLTAHRNEMVSNAKEPELLSSQQTVSHYKEPELSSLKQSFGHSEELQSFEQRQMASQFMEAGLSELRQTVNHSGEPKLFSCSSFWEEMESFVFTSKGAILVFHSRSRKDIALSFQKYGPQVLRSLSESDLLLLVGFLISEKKWLQERPSEAFPFRVIPGRTRQINLRESSECQVDKKQSILHTEASSPAPQKEHTEKSSTEKSRTDMTADVQKLVSKILKDHPNGCNMGLIRTLFLQKYGYHLDIGKLGYSKLSHLIQSLPGVDTEDACFFPANRGIHASVNETSILEAQETKLSDADYHYSDNELHDSYSEDDWKESPWEELGPVSVRNSNESDLESRPMQKPIELKTAIDPDYGYDLSDDDCSESEGDNSCLTQSGVKESPWEELGPDSVSNSSESDLESRPRQKPMELKTAIDPDYECVLSDDDSSESGGDISCLTRSEEKESPWEELGPDSVSNSNESDLESRPRQKPIELKTAIDADYECVLSDDDSSESRGGNSRLTQSEGEGQPKLNGEDSSLQTLDSLYDSQGEDSVNPNEVNTEGNGLTDGLNPSRISTPGTSSEIHSGGYNEKHMTQKNCSFDAEPDSYKNKELS
ncbi:uncharacterized protein LOC129296579 isoform X2 [Prosopis cineraria]|nr:uncharacterized protein LOC129296579 isoform X2 [Prosopis cineraria]